MKDSDQKRRSDLEASITDTLNLIKEYEDKLRYSGDPIEKHYCEQKIDSLRKLLEGHQAEIKRLEETFQIIYFN